MNKIKYSIAIAGFAFLSATAASAANYIYGNTTNDGNQTMNDARNWFEIDSFDGLNEYSYDYLTRVSETNTKFLPTASDNLLVKNLNQSSFDGVDKYNPAGVLASGSGNVYNIRSQSFGFPANSEGPHGNLFEINNMTFSVDPNYVLNTDPQTTAQINNVEKGFHWRPQGADGNIKIHGTLALEKNAKLTIQGDHPTNGAWTSVDIGKINFTTIAGSKTQLNLTSHIKETRIGVMDNGSGVLVANGTTSTIGNGTGLYTDLAGMANSVVYFGNFVAETGSDMHLKGGDFYFVGEATFNGNLIALHNQNTAITGNMTNNGTFDFRLGTYTGTMTNTGTFNMSNIEGPSYYTNFNGKLINSGTATFSRGIFTGEVENTGTVRLQRPDHPDAPLLSVAKMNANVTNRSSFTARSDAEFKGSFKAIGISSVSSFTGTSKADLSNETLHLQNAKFYVGESAKMLLSNTDFIYDFDTAGGFSAILEFGAVSNVDTLSVILGQDFGFMNIEEGYYDLIRFLDGGMYSSLAALIGETLNFQDKSTYDIFEGTFLSNSSGVFGIEFVLIPEPSTYAAIFGILALALVAYRRRK